MIVYEDNVITELSGVETVSNKCEKYKMSRVYIISIHNYQGLSRGGTYIKNTWECGTYLSDAAFSPMSITMHNVGANAFKGLYQVTQTVLDSRCHLVRMKYE